MNKLIHQNREVDEGLDEVIILEKGVASTVSVSAQQLYKYPFNCIGVLISKD